MNDGLRRTVKLYWEGVNEMNFVMKHDHGTGLIARAVDQQSSALPLYQERLHPPPPTHTHPSPSGSNL